MKTSAISEFDGNTFVLLIKIWVSASPFALMFSAQMEGNMTYERQRCKFVHRSRLKTNQMQCSLQVTGVMLTFPQPEKKKKLLY